MNKVDTPTHNIPAEIAAEIKAMGKQFNEEIAGQTREIYMPLLEAIDRSGITVTSDISYGAHERDRKSVV